jgi:hypothetical protein
MSLCASLLLISHAAQSSHSFFLRLFFFVSSPCLTNLGLTKEAVLLKTFNKSQCQLTNSTMVLVPTTASIPPVVGLTARRTNTFELLNLHQNYAIAA